MKNEEILEKYPLTKELLEIPRTPYCKVMLNMQFIKLKKKLHGKHSILNMIRNTNYNFILDEESMICVESLLKS